ncbi:RNA-binding protein lsm5 [Zygosaccharomyces mellis]|uniref:LSM complex subunit LSM5 n=1 Tax=Zygosaccharomyces mellis TaxID=42258 RepID=A0A4C2E2R7_9SACH|nr:RNA-binding protein lsm5 [Zygosaccharomyces mellis]
MDSHRLFSVSREYRKTCPTFVHLMSALEILPLEIIDKTIGQPVWIVLQSNREFTGTLIGFDDFVNVIVEDAKEITVGTDLQDVPIMQHKGRMLLSGNSIAMLVPGSKKA